jgi:hypothetical protein
MASKDDGPKIGTVYIASSWRNEHAVAMLSRLLRLIDIEVKSFIEFESGYSIQHDGDFNGWVAGEGGRLCFEFDTGSAMTSDLVIYLGPAGLDAWAEVGAAFGANHTIWGLTTIKGEEIGICRRMVSEWYRNVFDLIRDAEIFLVGKNYNMIGAQTGRLNSKKGKKK